MPAHKIRITKRQLLETYVDKALSANRTRILFNCSINTILERLREFGIHIRTKSEIARLQPRKFKITKEELYNLYWNRNMSTRKIGELFNVSHPTVENRLKEFNIPRRDAKENFKHMKFIGEDNFKYIDGRTPLCESIRNSAESKIWKSEIFKRDNYICQECGQIGRSLEAHHKNAFADLLQEFIEEYNQFSPIEDKETLVRLATKWKPFWDLNNGETLCSDCHKQTFNYAGKQRRIKCLIMVK